MVDEECAETVARALEAGYRHVDTAQMYTNETAVGDGIARAAVDREEVFVATKVQPGNLAHDDVLDSTEESREALGVDAIDLLYVHWPIMAYEPETTLPAFDELVDRGVVEHVGLCNFTRPLIAEARSVLDAPVVAHQVEMHPLLPQEPLVEDAAEHDASLVAYAPLGQAEILDHPLVVEVAIEHGATPAQVCLAWLVERDHVVPIPKGRGDHVEENLAATAVDLSGEAIDRLDDIEERKRLVDPAQAPWSE